MREFGWGLYKDKLNLPFLYKHFFSYYFVRHAGYLKYVVIRNEQKYWKQMFMTQNLTICLVCPKMEPCADVTNLRMAWGKKKACSFLLVRTDSKLLARGENLVVVKRLNIPRKALSALYDTAVVLFKAGQPALFCASVPYARIAIKIHRGI